MSTCLLGSHHQHLFRWTIAAEEEKWWMAGVVLHHPQHHLISSDLLSPIFLRFSPSGEKRKYKGKDRPSFFYFRSDQFTQSAFAIDIYKTDNGQQISYSPLFFLILLHKHLVRFLVFFISFGCLLCVLNTPDFGASITKVLEDLIPATLDSYL